MCSLKVQRLDYQAKPKRNIQNPIPTSSRPVVKAVNGESVKYIDPRVPYWYNDHLLIQILGRRIQK